MQKLELMLDAQNPKVEEYRLVPNPGFHKTTNENEDSVLTESSLVRHVGEKAPPVGLEPVIPELM